MALVLDTGVLYAVLDLDDRNHEMCVELVEHVQETLIVPEPVLVELDYLVRKTAGVDAWLAFCEDVDHGAYEVFSMSGRHVAQAAALQAKFSDQPIGFVDASVVVTCEAVGETKVATLDRRHFSILRTSDGRALELLPAA